MPPSTPLQPDPTRLAALRWALSRRGGDAASLAALHPDAKALAAAGDGATDLPELLWGELPLIEREASPRGTVRRTLPDAKRTPTAYWLRRRKSALREEWRWLVAELPDLWRKLIDLSAANVEDLAILLGKDMLAHIAAGHAAAGHAAAEQDGDFLTELLSPLDRVDHRPIATRVRELEGKALPSAVTAVWQQAYLAAAKKRTGARLLRWLAMHLLSNLLESWPDPRMRAAAARHCRSDLFNVLQLGGRVRLAPREHVPAIEKMVLEVLAWLRHGQAGDVSNA